ncbi:hypothetical protein [Caulobacter sp. 1776]|uniref:hypothetical protein n=1 Tax=Caulobacter sp. 1776 TaxID=3156420 RepID=UPI003394BE8D
MDEAEEVSKLAAWNVILDDFDTLAARIWSQCVGQEGYTLDPKMVSIQMFRRLRGHRDAFATLVNARLFLDSEIVTRAALETAICLLNLERRRDAFIVDLRSDASKTLKRQFPIWFGDDPDDERDANDGLTSLFGARRADGSPHDQLRFKVMAKDAAVPDLYDWYTYLSGTSVHVTGVSLFVDVVPEHADQLRRMRRVQMRGFMCSALFYGCRAEASMLGLSGFDADFEALAVRMSDVG